MARQGMKYVAFVSGVQLETKKRAKATFSFPSDEFVITGSFACKDEMKITEPAATFIRSTAAVTTMNCYILFLILFDLYVQGVRLNADVVLTADVVNAVS